MGKYDRKIQKRQDSVEQKHNVNRRVSEELHKNSKNQDIDGFSLTGTPFSPRIEEHAALLSRIPFTAQREDFILRLHQTYGSRYMQRLMESMNVQAELTVNDPNDIYEQEADKVADDVETRINSARGDGQPLSDEVNNPGIKRRFQRRPYAHRFGSGYVKPEALC